MPIRKIIPALILLVALSGCSEDDNPVIIPPAAPPGVATRDLVVPSFVAAYTTMDESILETILHPDYVMELEPSTALNFPAVGSTLDRAGQMQTAGRMFSGVELTTPDGEFLPAIASFQTDVFEQNGLWSEVPLGQHFAGSQMALFDISITIPRVGFSTMRTQGVLQMFVAESDTTISGTTYTYWQLRGIRDLTGEVLKSSENTSWSLVNALYWVGE